MAAAKKTTKKTPAAVEPTEEQPKFDPAVAGEDRTNEYWAKLGAAAGRPVLRALPTPMERSLASFPEIFATDEYIASEYPWLETSQNIPQLLKALVREVVKGRLG